MLSLVQGKMRPSIFKTAAAALVLTACSQADPTVFRPGFGERGSASITDAGESDGTAGGMTAHDGGDATTASDAPTATDAPTDVVAHADAMHEGGGGDGGGNGEGGMMANAFTNAPAYIATTGPSTLNAAHNFPNSVPITNPVGQACFSCHTLGGAGVEFTIGGTVYKDIAATIPAPQVQVAVRDNAGVTRTTYTDANGNFYILKADAGAMTPPAHPGVRDAANTRLMTGAIADGNCNNCHKTGGQTPINVP